MFVFYIACMNRSLCCRCTSGRPARPCLPARKVSSQCHPSPSGLRTTNTCPRPTRASRACTCRFTPPNRSSSRSSSSPSRPRTSALCRGWRVFTYLLCNITSSIFVDFFCLYSFMKFKRKCCPILGSIGIFFLIFLFFFLQSGFWTRTPHVIFVFISVFWVNVHSCIGSISSNCNSPGEHGPTANCPPTCSQRWQQMYLKKKDFTVIRNYCFSPSLPRT